MSLFTCPKCSSQFDVSNMQPGATFVCGSCKTVLQVPRKPAAPPSRPPAGRTPGRGAPGRAAPGRPAAPPGRPARGRPGVPGPGPKVDPRRAGAAAPPPAAPPGRPAGRSSGRPRGGPARRGGYEAPEKSKTPLILGGVAGVVVVIGIVAVLLMGGDDKKPQGGGGPDTASHGGGNTNPAVPTQVNHLKRLQGELSKGQGDLARVKAVFDEAKKLGIGSVAKMAANLALKIDKDLEWANLENGNKDLQKIYDRIPASDAARTYSIPEMEQLLEAQEYGPRWGTAQKYSELQKMLDKAIPHANKLDNDRFYRDEFRIIKNVELHPVYKDYKYRIERARPYVLFAEFSGKGVNLDKKAEAIVKRNGNIVKSLYEQFYGLFGEEFDMPRIEDLERDEMRTLKIWTFFNHKSFLDYQKKIGRPLPPGVAAYYRPDDQWITLFESPGRGSASGEVSFNISKIFHEGAHQLVHLYTKALMEKAAGGEEVLWNDRRTHSRAFWFQEGLAEFFGSAKDLGNGKWECFVPYKYRMNEWWQTRKGKRSEWTFEEIINIESSGELRQKAARKSLGNRNEVVRLSSLMYCQAWSFFHFLYYFGDGKYRDKLVAYAKKEFHGASSPAMFKKVWGAGEGYDWGPVEKEWRGYCDKLWADFGMK